MTNPTSEPVREFLLALQQDLCSRFAALEGTRDFEQDPWQRDASASGLSGGGVTAILEHGSVFERAGVAFSDVSGSQLPAAATARHPQLAGQPFRAMGVSVVCHPLNPFVPTGHMNVRFLQAGAAWWFGGGFDLTPYLPHEEDAVHWHRAAQQACAAFGETLYARLRQNCDEYFYLKHRSEARGVGGIFYDDLNADTPHIGLPWQRCFEFMRAVASHFRDAYVSIVQRRAQQPYGERERRYQLYRRARYVEFNLVLDRGTLFGLQSGGRTDSILISMPPSAHWSYRSPDPELDARLLPYLTTLRGRDWLRP